MNHVLEGSVIAGKYRVECVLGQGGMGVVVQAVHLQLDQRVAIKFLLGGALQKEAVVRFAREARAAVRIKSEHVAQVLDVGSLEDGTPYMVMEYLEGCDLSAYVERRGALPIPEAVEIVLQACEALADAHLLGIVHRDLKPANLFMTLRRDGSRCVKLLDFGISKVHDPDRGTLDMTKTATVMGSPFYMSPEQMRSTRHVDARADIWSIGVILYEIVTGRVPFDAETMPQLCGMILQEPPRSIRELRPDLPPAFEQVVLRCLEKDRDRRFLNVRELALALAPFADDEARRSIERISRVLGNSSPPGALSESNPALVDAQGAAVTQTTFHQTTPGGSRRRNLLMLSVALLTLGLAAGYFVFRGPTARSEEERSPATATSPSPPALEKRPVPALDSAPQLPETPEPAAAPSSNPTPSASAVAPEPPLVKAPRTRRPAAASKSTKPASSATPVLASPPAPRPPINPLDGRM